MGPIQYLPLNHVVRDAVSVGCSWSSIDKDSFQRNKFYIIHPSPTRILSRTSSIGPDAADSLSANRIMANLRLASLPCNSFCGYLARQARI